MGNNINYWPMGYSIWQLSIEAIPLRKNSYEIELPITAFDSCVEDCSIAIF